MFANVVVEKGSFYCRKLYIRCKKFCCLCEFLLDLKSGFFRFWF